MCCEAYDWEELDSEDLEDPYQTNIPKLHFLATSESFPGTQRHGKKRKKKIKSRYSKEITASKQFLLLCFQRQQVFHHWTKDYQTLPSSFFTHDTVINIL